MAPDYYADGSMADDTGDGLTPATAKKFAASALALAVSSGDTVNLQCLSTYAEELAPSVAGVTMEAYSEVKGDLREMDTRVRIWPAILASNAAVTIGASSITLRNLDVQHSVANKDGIDLGTSKMNLSIINCRAQAPRRAIVSVSGNLLNILGNIFEGASTSSSYYVAQLSIYTSRVIGNVIRHGSNGTHGLYVAGSNNNTVRRNRAYNNAGNGLVANSATGLDLSENEVCDNGGAGVVLPDADLSSMMLERNIVAYNAGGGVIPASGSTARNLLARNNIVYGNTGVDFSPVYTLLWDSNSTAIDPYMDATYAARLANNYRKAPSVKQLAVLRPDGIYTYPDLGAVQERVGIIVVED